MVAAGLDWALGVLARVGCCLELVAAGDSIDDCLALIRHGIDIGRVLCGDDTDGGLTIHRHDYVQVRELEGAFEALARLVRAHGVEAVHLVSKCSPATELRTLEWLAARDLEGRTVSLSPQLIHDLRESPRRGYARTTASGPTSCRSPRSVAGPGAFKSGIH